MTFLAILIIFFWGVWGLFEKLALMSGSPLQTLFAFLCWTTALFLPFAIFMLWKKQGKTGFKIPLKIWIWIFIAVLSDLVAVFALRFALLKSPAGIVLAVTAIYPIVTAILSVLVLREKISKWQYVGIFIICIGLFLLSLS